MKGLRVNYPIIFLSGLLILIASILTFLLIIKNIYGNYELSEVLPTKENLQEYRYSDRIGILYSNYTANMLGSDVTWVQDNIDTWKEFLKNMKIKYEVFSDLDLEEAKHQNYNLIILAGSKSMSDREVMEIKRYIDAGGSVLATGGVATFSDEAKWRGWDFFKETFGMKFTKELSPAEALKKNHTLRGNLPLTAGIPTGYILKIATWDRPVYAEILEQRTTQVSYWFDYRGEKGLVDEQIRKSAGIANGTYGKGRFVWYGFELNSVVGNNEDYTNLAKLVKNSVNWLTYNPTSFVKDWPEPYDAASIYLPTIEENINNISAVKSTIEIYKKDVSIIVDGELSLKHVKEMSNLANYGDIIPIIDLGALEELSTNEADLGSKEIQRADITYIRDSLNKITGRPIKGITPYYGFYNQTTLDVLAEENISYIITDSLTDRSVPNKIILNGKDVFIITNTSRDDIRIMKDFGLTDLEFQKYTYFEDIDRIIFEGGLYVLKLHNNYQLRPEFHRIFGDISKYMASQNIWITSLPELLKWWESKSGVELKYETRGKRRISVEVSNHKKTREDEFTVEVNFNKAVKNIEISAELINTPIPEFDFNEDTQIMYLYVKNLKEDESRTYLIDFENVNEFNANEKILFRKTN
ncbi:MAG: hypothetical protein KKF62_11025 [Bacteroidetes bacterium]|nr:hypothetical protein [Bacteroidota bacterium]MBU1115293.1 hypothetical protein [Bacteroidota bacterium]MBU1800151.1 hypothetical protein [Bacteroidota bacterium]